MRSSVSPAPWVWPAALGPVEDRLRRHHRGVSAALVGAVVVNELLYRGVDVAGWDWLFLTGYVTLLAGLRVGMRLPEHVHNALNRLAARQVLTDRNGDLHGFERRVHEAGRRAALAGGIVAPAVMLVAWTAAKRGDLPAYLLTVVGEVAASVPVGLFAGRAVSYGLLGRRLRAPRFALDVDPEHLDGAAGLRPVGDLYFFQAMLLAVPAAFLGVWWLAIPVVGRYADWRGVYAGLLVPVIVCEVLAFVLPMLSFHGIMKDAKRRLLADADGISHEVTSMQQAARGTDDDAERERIETRIARLTRRYVAIDTMRTWPVDIRIRRRFAVGNLTLFLPVLAQAVGAPDSWQQLLDSVQKVLTGS